MNTSSQNRKGTREYVAEQFHNELQEKLEKYEEELSRRSEQFEKEKIAAERELKSKLSELEVEKDHLAVMIQTGKDLEDSKKAFDQKEKELLDVKKKLLEEQKKESKSIEISKNKKPYKKKPHFKKKKFYKKAV